MHMSDSLVCPAVGAVMFAVSGAAVAYSAAKIKIDGLSVKKTAAVCAAGVFVFAAQALNFAIPGTGASGHIGGGILLAALLGAYPAFMAMTAILTIQCLAFADGGLLALGANVFNLGVIPCLIAYPLIFKPLAKKGMTALAAVVAVVAGLQLGALAVAIQSSISGALPFASFAPTMQMIHLPIGLVEGIVSAAIVYAICKARRDIEVSETMGGMTVAAYVPARRFVTAFALAAVVVGIALAPLASQAPDGLEWSVEKVVVVDRE